ncbi:MAG: hypothetical protein EOM20_06410 [Spartobacteria bacterium]|nr:hypothetical protein [Spartobacteria bacterium]
MTGNRVNDAAESLRKDNREYAGTKRVASERIYRIVNGCLSPVYPDSFFGAGNDGCLVFQYSEG